MKKNKISIRIHPITYLFFIISIFCGEGFELLYFIILFCIHELGHLFFLFFFKKEPKSILILPIGGILQYQEHKNDYNEKEFLISIGGILFQLILGIIFQIIKINSDIVYYNQIILFFNLIPVWPLDGGRALFYLLANFMELRDLYQYYVLYSIFFLIGSLLYIIIFQFRLNSIFIVFFLIEENIQYYRKRKETYQVFLMEKKLHPNTMLKEKQVKKYFPHPCYHFYRGYQNYISQRKKRINEKELLNQFYKEEKKNVNVNIITSKKNIF